MLFRSMFKAAGASKVIITDMSDYRLDYSRKMGFDLVVDPSKEDFEKFVLRHTGIGADVIVDAAGSALADAVKVVRKGGKIVAFGVNTRAVTTFPQSQITIKEMTIFGAWLANATFPAAVKVLEARSLDLDGLISHKMPLKDLHKGIEMLANRQAMKIVVYP